MIQRAAAPLRWLAALAIAYLCAPLLAGLDQVGQADWHGVDTGALARAAAISVGSATLAAALAAMAGVPLAYCLARGTSRAVAWLGLAVQLPLALPPLASGVLLLFLLGPYSWLGRLGGGVLTDSFTGIVLAQTFVCAPFLIVAARSAFEAVDPILEDVGATLGHHARSRFWSISLPGAWAGIRAGLMLAWLRAFGEFGATVMVAYHPYSLPVYTYVSFGAQGLPAMLPVLVPTLGLALVMGTLAAFSWQRPRPVPHIHQDTPHPGDDVPMLLPVPGLGTPSRVRADGARLPPGDAAAEAAVRANAPHTLALDFVQQAGSFRLTVQWHTRAQRLAILGRSGSGKSMTLRVIAGLDAAQHATLSVDGERLDGLPAEARGVAYVPQDYGLFPHMTVARQLAFPVGASEVAARDWLAHLGLTGLADRLPASLSLGQRQRVALARAMVRPSRLILLDEPFAALDSPRRRQLRRTLRALQREIEATTILVTHDPEDAILLADEILVLDDGAVLQSGPVEQLLRRPANARVAQLLALDNVWPGTARPEAWLETAEGTRLATAGHGLAPGTPVMWRIDPRHVVVAAQGRYAAEVTDPAHRIPVGQLAVRLGGVTLLCSAGGASQRAYAPGEACRVDCAADAFEVWPAEPTCSRDASAPSPAGPPRPACA